MDAFIRWFRNAAPYINAHRDKTFVIAITGETVDHPVLESLVHDVALLHSLGTRIVLIHGARPQIEASLGAAGLSSTVVDGRRVTDLDTLDHAIAAVGRVRTRLEALFSMGLINSPMHGLDLSVVSGNFVTAQPLGVLDGVDFHHTGGVRDIDVAAIRAALDRRSIVLMSTLGYSPTGEVFNVTLDNLVGKTATLLGADKLIVLCDLPDALREAGTAIHPDTVSSELGDDEEDRALLTAAANACLAGVPRVHLLDYRSDGALLEELFSRSGSCVLVQKEEYETCRTATIDDVGGILELIRPMEQSGALVTRSRERLEQEIHHFLVLEMDGMIIGCAALYPYAAEKTGEIACVAVHPDFRGRGRASLLLDRLERDAAATGIERLFVLSTQTMHWFVERGYAAASTVDLPQQRQSMYNLQRNSRIYLKTLPAET